MENLLTYYKATGTLHIRCPICGNNNRLILPYDLKGSHVDRQVLHIENRLCDHIKLSSDGHMVKVDLPDFKLMQF
jgi:hypothetical protein